MKLKKIPLFQGTDSVPKYPLAETRPVSSSRNEIVGKVKITKFASHVFLVIPPLLWNQDAAQI
jgi:hypothetical protein